MTSMQVQREWQEEANTQIGFSQHYGHPFFQQWIGLDIQYMLSLSSNFLIVFYVYLVHTKNCREVVCGHSSQLNGNCRWNTYMWNTYMRKEWDNNEAESTIWGELENYPELRDELTTILQEMRNARQPLYTTTIQPIFIAMIKVKALELIKKEFGFFIVTRESTR